VLVDEEEDVNTESRDDPEIPEPRPGMNDVPPLMPLPLPLPPPLPPLGMRRGEGTGSACCELVVAVDVRGELAGD
jgi:hypothetical protein